MLINLKHISGFGINQLQQFQNNLVRKRNQLSQNRVLCIKEFYLFIEFFFSYIRRIWTSCAESISYDIFRSRSFKINIVFQLHCVHVQKSIHKEITHFACTSAMEFGIQNSDAHVENWQIFGKGGIKRDTMWNCMIFFTGFFQHFAQTFSVMIWWWSIKPKTKRGMFHANKWKNKMLVLLAVWLLHAFAVNRKNYQILDDFLSFASVCNNNHSMLIPWLGNANMIRQRLTDWLTDWMQCNAMQCMLASIPIDLNSKFNFRRKW